MRSTATRITSIPFLIAGLTYLVATAVIHLLLPRLEPMTFYGEST